LQELASPDIRKRVHPKALPPPDVIRALLALNAAHEIETSPLDEPTLSAMLDAAFFRAAPGDGRHGMMIAFDQDAAYDGTNFKWFRTRFSQFIYVDRIIIAPDMRGQGLARALYGNLMQFMRQRGQSVLACEINTVPPNPASLAMHAALGFAELAQANLAKGKTVSYQVLHLD
jgi:predicted GNAT superfamily acetyltransferase